MINLDSPDILTAQEAAKIWGKNEAYVRTALKQNPDKFPDGSVRRFGNDTGNGSSDRNKGP